jgi:hypothetical protein
MRRIRKHLTYANVLSSIALFLVFGGGTAVALNGSNTVFSDDIVNGQVQTPDLQPAENWHEVGTGLATGFACGGNSAHTCDWHNVQGRDSAAYYRDPYGVVRLKGFLCIHALDKPAAGCNLHENDGGKRPVFTLPAGYRPGKLIQFSAISGNGYIPA